MKFTRKNSIKDVQEEADKALTIAGLEVITRELVTYVGERKSNNSGNMLSVFKKESNGGFIIVLLSQVAKYVVGKKNLPFVELKDGAAKFNGAFHLSSSKEGLTMSPA